MWKLLGVLFPDSFHFFDSPEDKKMRLAEILEKERGGIRTQLLDADTPEAAQGVLGRAVDKLLYHYVEDSPSDREKETASHMAECAKASVSLVDTAGEPEVWEKNAAGTDIVVRKQKTFNPLGVLIFLIGLVLLTAGVVLIMTKVPQITKDGIWEIPLSFAAGGVVVTYLGGLFSRRRKKEEPKIETEKKVLLHTDPDKLYRSLQAIVITMDRQLEIAGEEERADLRRLTAKEEDPLPREELELFAGLMEAAASRDEEYALEKIEDVKYYLHKNHVDTVDYTREHEDWFELLPSEEAGTIRPALVSEGRLLVKGLAAGGN